MMYIGNLLVSITIGGVVIFSALVTVERKRNILILILFVFVLFLMLVWDFCLFC